MKKLLPILLVTALWSKPGVQLTTQDYLKSLVGRHLILRHYAESPNPEVKEKDLIRNSGRCDQAVEVMAVAFERASVDLRLRNIGVPFVRNKNTGCSIRHPEEYALKITEFALDEPLDQAETSIGYVLQTPEAYLMAYGVEFNFPQSSESEPPVNFPHPGLTPPVLLLTVNPGYSERMRKAHIQGTVTIECVIGTDGLVHSPVVSKGLTDESNKLALDALTFWRLEPVRENARAVAAKLPVTISFRLL